MKPMALAGVLLLIIVITTTPVGASTIGLLDGHASQTSLAPMYAQERTTTGTGGTPGPATLTPDQPGERVDVWLGDQTSNGSSVTVSIATLPEGGFVAIHTLQYSATRNETYGTTEQVNPESVIGVSEYLAPDAHENVPVKLSEPLNRTRELVVIAYHDTNENRAFEFARSNGTVDGPYIVPYVSGKGGKTVASGPAIGTGTVAVGESLREAGVAVGTAGTADAGAAGAAGGSTSEAMGTVVQTPTTADEQMKSVVRNQSETMNGERSGGSGPGFGLLVAGVALLSTLVLMRRV